MLVSKNVYEFEWDKGNINKNLIKHKVTNEESEEAFLDKKRKIFKDVFHSEKEARYILLGNTKKGRSLYIAFTERNKKIRIISARNINKKEASLYK